MYQYLKLLIKDQKMTFYFINPHQNHSLGKTISSLVTLRNTASKMSFILDSAIQSGNLGVLKNEESFPELPRYFPRSVFFDNIDIKLWSLKKKIKHVLPKGELNKTSPNDYLFLTTKDTKYKNLLEILIEFKGKIVLLLDDHLFSTYKVINEIIEQIGSKRIKSASIASVSKNPFFMSMPLSQIKETIIGWPISERFSLKKDFSNRLNRVLALGVLTYRQFNKEIMTKLLDEKLYCVHPDREYLYHNHYCSKYIDSKIPMRDYRFKEDGFLNNFLKRVYNKYNTMRYFKIDLPEMMNDYKFVMFPSMFDESPCLGMLEAMASGSILIGTNAYAYKSLGLVENYNYISIGEKMDVNLIDSVVDDQFKNKDKYISIQKKSLDWVEQFKKSNFLEKFDLKDIL